MKIRYTTLTVAALTLVTSLTVAAAAPGSDMATNTDHAAHHPAATASESGAPSAQQLDTMRQMASQQKSMQEMHQKFMAATTPEERQALMPEHMKAMQEGMDMMQGMSGMGGGKGMGMGMGMMQQGTSGANKGMGMMGDMAAHHQMMEQRMTMMQTMMQMMMDHLPGATEK